MDTMDSPNRREFLKASSVGAAFTIAQGINVRAYAKNDKIQIGVIGTGGQGCYLLRRGISAIEPLQVLGIADVFEPHQKRGTPNAQMANAKVLLSDWQQFGDLDKQSQAAVKAAHKPTAYYDYKQMLAELGDKLDAVVVATPPHTHHEIVMACLNAGKHVYCEKILATSIEHCREIVLKCHVTGKFVQVGHDRRYNPKYNHAMDYIYKQGFLGRITHMAGQWHRDSNWRRYWQEDYGADYQLNDEERKFIPDLEHHINWRMYADLSGGLIEELASHHIDTANWFLRAMPTRVYADAGLEYWRDGRETADHVALIIDYDQLPGAPGFIRTKPRSNQQDPAALNSAYRVRFAYSTLLTNSWRGVFDAVLGEHAAIELGPDSSTMFAEPGFPFMYSKYGAAAALKQALLKNGVFISRDTPRTYELGPKAKDGLQLLSNCTIDENVVYAFQDFADKIRNGGKPRVNEMDGLVTAVGAIAAVQSAKERRPVDIDPAWYKFDFETPPLGAFEFDESKYDCKEDTGEN